MSYRILGIYLEDSTTYVGSLVDDNAWLPTIDPHSFIHTHFPNLDLPVGEMIREALKTGARLHADIPIRCISVAAPGPMRDCGNMKPSAEYGVINRYSRERERFNRVSLLSTITESLAAIGMASAEVAITINHDAAAHAIGEYHRRRPPRQPSRRNWEDWTHVHVVVNDGIGGAIINNGIIVQGRMHSELGHVHVLRHQSDRESNRFRCEAHEWQDCLEGMVGLAALKNRWGEDEVSRIAHWAAGDPRLSVISSYFAQLCTMLTLIVAPKHIVFSGAPFKNPFLADSIRRMTRDLSARTDGISPYPGYREQSADNFIDTCEIPEAAALGTCILGTRYHRTRPPTPMDNPR